MKTLDSDFRLFVECIIYREAKPFQILVEVLSFSTKEEADIAYIALWQNVAYGTRNVIKLYNKD